MTRKVERFRRYAEKGGRDAIDAGGVEREKLYVYFFFLWKNWGDLSGIGGLGYWEILGIRDGFMEFLRVHDSGANDVSQRGQP